MNTKPLFPYFAQQLAERQKNLPPHLQEKLLQEAAALSEIGVSSEEEHKNFLYILRHAATVGSELIGRALTLTEISKLSQIMYQNRNKIAPDSILNLYKLTELSLQQLGLSLKKIAYPTGDTDIYIKPAYDIQKWITTMRSYYALVNRGYPNTYCFNMVTNGWDEMETRDFKSWMLFYEENAHKKYKIAQSKEPKYYHAGEGAMVPLEHLKARLPGMPDMSQYSGQDSNFISEERFKQQQTKQEEAAIFIKAIIGRLNAAEKLVTRPEVQVLLQKLLNTGLGTWLESLHRLKREIQTAPLRSVLALKDLHIKEINKLATESLIQDLLFREANILSHQGKIQSSRLMHKLAQEMSLSPAPPSATTQSETGEEALEELIEGMNNVKDDDTDKEDVNQVQDMEDDPLSEMTIIAQAIPPPMAKPDIEVSDEILGNPPGEPTTHQDINPSTSKPTPSTQQKIDLTDPFESALAHVSIVDVVTRLEALANIFRNREIARQLAIIDLMMNKLGIASFFPSLAEASSKSLESNQYALTRIEDILSKLRGSIETPAAHEVELTGPVDQIASPVPNVNPEAIKQNLMQDQVQDKIKKERRKELEEAKSVPQITNAPQELAQPVTIAPSR